MRLYIFGGVGDHDALMRLTLPIWRRHGFTTKDVPFGWNNGDEDLDARLTPFLAELDALPETEQVVLIGTSAGGVIANIVLQLRPKRVARIVTVCSPLLPFGPTVYPLLNVAIKKLQDLNTQAGNKLQTHITSFRAQADSVVAPQFSVLPGAQNVVLPSRGHVWTIALAMTIYRKRIAQALKTT